MEDCQRSHWRRGSDDEEEEKQARTKGWRSAATRQELWPPRVNCWWRGEPSDSLCCRRGGGCWEFGRLEGGDGALTSTHGQSENRDDRIRGGFHQDAVLWSKEVKMIPERLWSRVTREPRLLQPEAENVHNQCNFIDQNIKDNKCRIFWTFKIQIWRKFKTICTKIIHIVSGCRNNAAKLNFTKLFTWKLWEFCRINWSDVKMCQ